MKLTMLNSMAGSDFPAALDRQRALGMSWLDLKDQIFGTRLELLSDEQAKTVRELVSERALSIYCLSSGLGNYPLEMGESAWRAEANSCLDRVLAVARILQPTVVRLLCARTHEGSPQGLGDILRRYPWMAAAYADLSKRIADAGFRPLAENEAHHCVVATPRDAVDFIAACDADADLGFIWDVQNMWQVGTFPTVADVGLLMPVLAGLHLKGGVADEHGRLARASNLQSATWPVREIVRAVIDTGLVDVVCLNPSHGAKEADFDVFAVAVQDATFLRSNFPEFAA
ncbi:MAG: TIM barrel protein [Devosia sp.]|uniref:sugar phosphate isomerase/epimerase family protein n=1 Tax=Devosia sp. TaxID=1871048 RepID=UPI0024CB0530|nr:TIM barrel protein [Devosia sp.]UYO00218.1 MAG: TIM barrel protein [Devosia sp.]